MGLFSKNKEKVVWRNASGKISCPGDRCPKECDDTCPIFLNTQAGMLCQMGMGNEAVPIFEEILRIAPDFYDAWNNIAGVYGSRGEYRKAYECYLKAHQIEPSRPAPVLGLGLTTRDLGKYEECIKWCNEYDRLSKDHRLDSARSTAMSALGKSAPKEAANNTFIGFAADKGFKIVKQSESGEWAMLQSDKRYIFAQSSGGKVDFLKTPGGKNVETLYKSLADRIFDDLDCFGYNYRCAASILSWHFSMIDNFSVMEHDEVERILEESFLRRDDWTFRENRDNPLWVGFFGDMCTRRDAIRSWLSKCTHMQLTAACCIGNAYESINIAFVLAKMMENYEDFSLEDNINLLAGLISGDVFSGTKYDIVRDFQTFELYYGIHLKENGKIINEAFGPVEIKDESEKYVGCRISVETLVGRNYYLYTDGKKDAEQPLVLSVSDLELDGTEEEEPFGEDEDTDDEEEYNELLDYIPKKCWIKRLSAVQDGVEAYYLIAITVDDEEKIESVSVISEEVERTGAGWFMIPGMELPGESFFDIPDCFPDETVEELDMLIAGRYLTSDFSFIGKKLPESMASENSNEHSYSLQSAYRLAYMHVSVNTDGSGIINSLDYSTYQSSGNSFNDLFSRPQLLADRTDEALDMLLHILDSYSEDEYKAL